MGTPRLLFRGVSGFLEGSSWPNERYCEKHIFRMEILTETLLADNHVLTFKDVCLDGMQLINNWQAFKVARKCH